MTTRVYTISRIRMRRVEMEKKESEGLRSTGRIQEEGETRSGWKEILSFFFFFSFSTWKVVCACVCVRVISRKKMFFLLCC